MAPTPTQTSGRTDGTPSPLSWQALRPAAEPDESLTEASLGEVIETLQHHPFLQGSGSGLRLSLAGAQRKLPVRVDAEGELYLPRRQPSTHILKPPVERFPGLVENEYLCMRAARQAGLDVPEVTLRPFVDREGLHHDAYLVARYDRITLQGRAERLHQEDLCQVLAIPSARKYTADGGPGFGDVVRVLREHTRPSAIHLRELIRRLLFNLMIGNQDAHGKNISLLHQLSGQVALAPAYDIVSTLVYDSLTDHLAMPVGGVNRIKDLDQQAMGRFEEETRIHLRRQAGTLHRFLDTALRAARSRPGRPASTGGRTMLRCWSGSWQSASAMRKCCTIGWKNRDGKIGTVPVFQRHKLPVDSLLENAVPFRVRSVPPRPPFQWGHRTEENLWTGSRFTPPDHRNGRRSTPVCQVAFSGTKI